MTYQDRNDVVESLKNEIKINTDAQTPILKFSTKTYSELALQENKQFEIIYKADLDEAMKRKKK